MKEMIRESLGRIKLTVDKGHDCDLLTMFVTRVRSGCRYSVTVVFKFYDVNSG